MTGQLTGKVAIVTGASKGIGAAIALRFAAEGEAVPSSAAIRETILEASTPLRRIGQPHDIAPAAVFLASHEASWITGETFVHHLKRVALRPRAACCRAWREYDHTIGEDPCQQVN